MVGLEFQIEYYLAIAEEFSIISVSNYTMRSWALLNLKTMLGINFQFASKIIVFSKFTLIVQ